MSLFGNSCTKSKTKYRTQLYSVTSLFNWHLLSYVAEQSAIWHLYTCTLYRGCTRTYQCGGWWQLLRLENNCTLMTLLVL
jgi:hypothetical protein